MTSSSTPALPRGVVLDAGAFIAVERRSGRAVHRMALLYEVKATLVTSASVVTQVWRGTPRQAPLAVLLQRTEIVDLTAVTARVLGRMLGQVAKSDPTDAHIAYLALERGWPVLTSDPDDILAFDPELRVEIV